MKILNKMNKEQRAQDLEQEEFMIIDMKAHVSKIKKLDFIRKKKLEKHGTLITSTPE